MRALLLCCLLQACATVPWRESALPCLRHEWLTLSSQHFDLYSDRDEGTARDLLIELERVFSVFVAAPELGVPLRAAPPGRITVVVFASEDDFGALHDPAYADGIYTTVYNELEPKPVIVIRNEMGAESREAIIHELSHRFLLHAAPASPRWLVEGLAEYQSSLEVADGEVRLGAGPMKYFHFNATIGPPLELFHGRAGVLFYPEAFALVHLLNDTPERRHAFREYLTMLTQGTPPVNAFAGSIALLDWKRINREMPDYMTRNGYPTLSLPYHPPRIEISGPRKVGHAELHRLWASVRPWSRANAALVDHDLDEAEKLEPGSTETRYLRAAHHGASGDIAGASADLEPLLRAHPTDLRLETLAAVIANESERSKPPAERVRTLAQIDKLAAMATTASSRCILAQLWASVGRVQEALSASEAALRDTPADDRLHAIRAWALHNLARDREAAEAMSISIGLTPHGRVDPQRQRLLEEYRKAAAGGAQ